MDQVARECGFVDLRRMRETFLRQYWQPPQALRRSARAAGDSCPAPSPRVGQIVGFADLAIKPVRPRATRSMPTLGLSLTGCSEAPNGGFGKEQTLMANGANHQSWVGLGPDGIYTLSPVERIIFSPAGLFP